MNVEIWYDNEANPDLPPEWVGYDVLRRSLEDCHDFERINESYIPRGADAFHMVSFLDEGAAPGVAYEYKVIPVDGAREPVTLLYCWNCDGRAYQGCPESAAAIAHGAINTDLGWTLIVSACPGSCYWSFFLSDPWPEELRAYVGTGTNVKFFGRVACGGIEGCGLMVDHYELEDCVPVQTEDSTWGRLKSLYR